MREKNLSVLHQPAYLLGYAYGAIASLANTLITVMEPVPKPLLSSMPLLQL
jgi:hypothetical protein